MKLLSGVALLLALSCSSAAAEGIEGQAAIAVGMVCDTAQQVERYVALYQEGASAEAALDTVNAEHKDAHACAILTALFVVREQVEMLSVKGGNVQIVAVTIFATNTASGWQQTKPVVQYTAIFAEAEDT